MVLVAVSILGTTELMFIEPGVKINGAYFRDLLGQHPKQLLLRNCAVDFVEICNVYVGKTIIKAAKRIFNSDKICRSYSDLNFGVTFLEHSVI